MAKFTLGAMGPAADMDEYERRLMRPQVIATTALTIDQCVLHARGLLPRRPLADLLPLSRPPAVPC